MKKIIATLFFAGYAPIAPGTAGTAVVAVGYFWFGALLSTWSWLAVLAAVFCVGVYTANAMERLWGEDPGRVVIDEGVGFLTTVAFLPHSLWMAIAGFLLFRILDIVKPAPARQCEQLPGGWGIVADDFVAGLYGNLLLRLGLYVAGGWSGA